MTKSRSIMWLMLLAVVASSAAFGQQALPTPAISALDDIITKHINALGGREKLLSLKTERITADGDGMGMTTSTTTIESQLVGLQVRSADGQRFIRDDRYP